MIKSLITTSGVALKQQPIEDLSHFFKRRLRAELGNGKGIGSFCQLIDLIVIRQFKSDFHLMHRDGTFVAQAPYVVGCHPLKDAVNVILRGFLKVSECQIHSLVMQHVVRLFIKARPVCALGNKTPKLIRCFHFHFSDVSKLKKFSLDW